MNLVVGGTGMLRGVALHLSPGPLAVVSRRRRLDFGRSILLDWHDGDRLERAIRELGRIDLAVCWIHSDAKEAPSRIAAAIGDVRNPPRYFQVFGNVGPWTTLPARKDIRYREVLLGSIGGRWLTHEEICGGVIRAIETDAPTTCVGER